MSVEIHLPGVTMALPARLGGMIIGVFLDVPDAAASVVAYPGYPSEHGLAATTTVQLNRADIGTQAALMFIASDPHQPLLIGRIQRLPQEALAQLNGERLKFSAEHEIVLRCGKISITLTRAGKVIIHGAYLFSRSTEVDRIESGSVQIN